MEEKDGAFEDAIIGQMKFLCPCRSTQIEQLVALFGEKDELTCPCVFVYGNTGTGKSHVLKVIMNVLKLKHVIINCIEYCSAKLIFETILESLSTDQDLALELLHSKKCDNFNDFIRCLKQLMSGLDGRDKSLYLIFNKAERLRNMEHNLLPGLIRLAELTKMNICVILETEITVERFLSGTSFAVPTVVHFSEYNQKELVKIMSLDCPPRIDKKVYSSYCQLLISVFFLACRDLVELQHLAIVNFAAYYEPLEKNEDVDIRTLWRNIEPKLKKCFSNVYMREVTKPSKDELQNVSRPGISNLALELPFFSKYLLIAAFLASNNPSRTDRRFFCKRSYGKMSKKTKTSVKRYATDNKLTGPKVFSLDRLLAIFFSIIEDDINPTANLRTQVSSLVSLSLLGKVSCDDQLDIPKYRCLVNAEFINMVASNLDFQLQEYLFDV